MKSDLPPVVMSDRVRVGRFRELVVEFDRAYDESAAAEVAGAVQIFAQLGQLGGFCSGEWQIASSRCVMRDTATLPRAIRFACESANIDLRAFQILRNMLGRLAEDGIRVTSIAVDHDEAVASDMRVLPHVTEGNEDDAYPTLNVAARLDFDENPFDSHVRRCLVELARPVVPEDIEALWDYVDPWFDALEAGGFSMPVALPWEAECMSDTITQFDEYTIEVSVLRFQASEAAWDTFANLLHHFAEGRRPLVSLLVD